MYSVSRHGNKAEVNDHLQNHAGRRKLAAKKIPLGGLCGSESAMPRPEGGEVALFANGLWVVGGFTTTMLIVEAQVSEIMLMR